MSVKIVVSATEESEREEILQALEPVVKRKKYRIKKKPPTLGGNVFYVAYIGSRKHGCK